MGDRHGGRFARRGRALNPPRPQVDAHHGVGFRWRATVFRCRGVVGRICPAQERSPRRRPPDTARRRKDLPTQEHAPRRKSPDTAHERKDLPRGVRPRPTCRRTAGRPRPMPRKKNTPSAGSHPQRAAAAEFIHRKKIRLLHETQLFYGESHVGSPQIFPSFPSVGRCVARERNPVPPVALHRGSGHRGLRRTGEMCHGFGEMVR